MKTQNDLATESRLSILLIGEPFARKSTIASHFPDPWICDADGNLPRIAHLPHMKGKRFWFDRIDTDDSGTKIEKEYDRWKRFLKVATEAANHPEVKFLVFDSMTAIGHILERFIINEGSSSKDLVIGGEKSMTLQLWNPYKDLWLKLITAIKASPKHCIFIAHRKVDKDEVLGTLDYKPMIGGQLADSLGRLFTDAWHCVAEPGQPTKDNPTGVTTIIETVPQPRMKQLGNSLDLPPRWKFEPADLTKRLKERGYV
jgi:hypothetical protein